MKRSGYMMYPKMKRAAQKSVLCNRCGKALTPAEACYYVDGCNCAITNNAPAYCIDCYKAGYEAPVKSTPPSK